MTEDDTDVILCGTSDTVSGDGGWIYRDGSDNKIKALRVTSSTTFVDIVSTSTVTVSDGWVHILASGTTTPAFNLYINNTDEKNVNTLTNGAWAGSAKHGIRSSSLGVSEYYVVDEYIDFSSSGNRDKFIDSNGAPVFLGYDGSVPTGGQAEIYSPSGNFESDDRGSWAMGDTSVDVVAGPNPY